ncbi:hypothetical protein IP78_05020 [Brevundimonas sp. AAP58]|uniref:DUF3828 domain-containing protein n=1 Tax=Brevundimonas sp. AAP58 TaxID=1523422 RepID=UPI0006B953BA|nr:DUF3828 domain-containing protein [Brevundimonas sp. AAP58]KPF81372.1 hypothetical protein IP78_05020 [Brevundimonas sp. AAP58]
MRILISLAALTAVAACSPAEEAQTPAAPEAAAPSADPRSREAVYAVQAESPEAFVRALYARYTAGGPTGEPPAPGRDPLFSRTMNALIGADARAANGDVPTLNYDPLCGCQDQGEFVVTALAVAQADTNTAEANVSFTNGGEAKTLTLELVREGPNWKIEDIVDGTTSLYDTLMAVAERAG